MDGQLLHVTYLGRVTCDCDPEEEHGHTHPSHHGEQECVPGVPIAGQPYLGHKEGRKVDSQKLEGLPFTPVVTTPSTAPSETRMAHQQHICWHTLLVWFKGCTQSNCAKQKLLVMNDTSLSTTSTLNLAPDPTPGF